jgi:hypothetical protein
MSKLKPSWRRKLALALCPALDTELDTLRVDNAMLEMQNSQIKQYRDVSEAHIQIAGNFQAAIHTLHAEMDRLWSDAYLELDEPTRREWELRMGLPAYPAREGEALAKGDIDG